MRIRNFVILFMVFLLIFVAVPLPFSVQGVKNVDRINALIDGLVAEKMRNAAIELVYSFAEAINNKDADAYISLFTKWNQELMRLHIERSTAADFFQEDAIELINVKELVKSKDFATNLTTEYERYEDAAVFYTEEYITLISDADVAGMLENGYNYRIYVVVKENGEWKIERVSTPSIFNIVLAGEGFYTKNEQEKMDAQRQ